MIKKKKFYQLKDVKLLNFTLPETPTFKNKTGLTFSDLKVLKYAGHDRIGKRNRKVHYYFCKCNCGNIVRVRNNSLVTKLTTSCGCNIAKSTIKRLTKHGMCYSKEWRAWKNMKRRCLNPKRKSFKNYGARGIKVCERWLGCFENFFEDMGKCPEGMSLDRIDVNGNYEPNNCRWADLITQANNKRNSVKIKDGQEELSIEELAKKTGIKSNTIRVRISKGMTKDEICNTPVRVSKPIYTIFNGERRMLKDIAKEINFNYPLVSSRIQNGWDLEKALKTPKSRTGIRRLFTFLGLTKNISQWAKFLNVSRKKLSNKLNDGWTIDKFVRKYNIEI